LGVRAIPAAQYPPISLRLSAHEGTAWFQALFGEAFYHLWYLKSLIAWRLLGPVLEEGAREVAHGRTRAAW
jgi:hypothetical protein